MSVTLLECYMWSVLGYKEVQIPKEKLTKVTTIFISYRIQVVVNKVFQEVLRYQHKN